MESTVKRAKLSSVCQINPRLRQKPSTDTLISFVPMASVSEKGFLAQEDLRPFGEVSKGYTHFEQGDLLLAKITPCFENMKSCIATTSQKVGVGSTEFHVFRPNALDCDARYLFHFLRRDAIRAEGIKNMTGSGGQRRVPAGFFENLEIPLPPLAEQRRIAEILDRAETLRAKRREAIALLDELGQALFLEMFGDPVTNPRGWPIVPFEQAVKDSTSGNPKIPLSEYLESGKYPIIDQGKNEIGGWSDNKEFLSKTRKPVIVFGDHTKIFKLIEYDFILGADGVKLLEAVNGFDCQFIFNLLVFVKLPSVGYSRHFKYLKELLIMRPPLELQHKYRTKMLAISNQRKQLIESEECCSKLFASLQHRAFRGEL